MLSLWRCRNGHILGYVYAGRLYVFSAALAEPPNIEDDYRIITQVTGDARVTCSICRDEREWYHAPQRVVTE